MSMFKFLPGILVVQAATAALAAAVLAPSSSEAVWVPLAVLTLVVTLIAALWFGSIAEHVKKDALTEARVQFAREREHIRVTAETDKRAALEDTHQRLVKETRRAQNRANLQLGLGLAGLLALGGLMLAIEFMTVGLLMMATAGGALGGYVFRARQEARAVRRKAAEALPRSRPIKAIEAERVDSPR